MEPPSARSRFLQPHALLRKDRDRLHRHRAARGVQHPVGGRRAVRLRVEAVVQQVGRMRRRRHEIHVGKRDIVLRERRAVDRPVKPPRRGVVDRVDFDELHGVGGAADLIGDDRDDFVAVYARVRTVIGRTHVAAEHEPDVGMQLYEVVVQVLRRSRAVPAVGLLDGAVAQQIGMRLDNDVVVRMIGHDAVRPFDRARARPKLQVEHQPLLAFRFESQFS